MGSRRPIPHFCGRHSLGAVRFSLPRAFVTEVRAAFPNAGHTMGKKQKLAIKGQVPPPASPTQAG